MNQSFVRVRLLVLGLIGLLLTGCGFKMQGVTPMPFDSLAITIPQNSQFGADVRRAIRAASPNTVIIEPSVTKDIASDEIPVIDPKNIPQARLEQVSDVRNSRIVSLNAQGKPEEFELTLVYTFRLVNAKNQIILPDTTLSAARSMPFDERVVQAKEGEAATLFKDMQKSLVARMMRRLTAPDIKQRWDALNALTTAEQENIDVAVPVQAPSVIPSPWQNPSLTPIPIPVNPGG
ncbi:LPS assembly lipoprotein LptE [Zwartia panacis]|jgi:LPS-assembly lipoprotein|uniref:LPS-assembly lipoprotein LptE n=1 Tax=Zwartia panacis TaxID=2683345 RepID=UPI0025B4F576|nr:LPS assembly lipoprotein LptE [Zwartia panacis]MDN4016574.1 LPS assembly lipoprotein LptE [Zwartia panacis]